RRDERPMTPLETELATAPSNVLPIDVDDEPRTLRPPARGPWSTTKKYANILRASLKERMAYRADFLLGTVLRFLPMVTTILLWQAIYKGSGQTSLGNKATQYTYNEM